MSRSARRSDSKGRAATQPSPPRQRRTERRWHTSLAAKTLLCAGSLVLALLLAELGFRTYYRIAGLTTRVVYGSESEDWKRQWIDRHRAHGIEVLYGYDEYHPVYGWKLRPNLSSRRFGEHPPVTTNAQGWRSKRAYEEDRPDGVKRIVTLGDSFTFGEEVADDDIWTVQLEQQLDALEVYNFATHGSGTDQQLLILEREGIKYQPDIVILGFYVADVLRNGLSFRDYAKPRFLLEDDELVLTNVPVPSPEETLAQDSGERPWSYLVHFARNAVSGRFTGSLDDLIDDRDLLPLTRAIMERMRDVTVAAGAKLMVVVIPSLHHPMPRVEEALHEWSQSVEYEVVSLRHAFDVAEKDYGRSMYMAHHFSPLGNVVAATVVRQALVDAGWVRPPSRTARTRLERRLAEVLDMDEHDAVDYFNRGKRLADRGEFDEAIRFYRKSLELQPNSPTVSYFLARALHRLGRLDEAADAYRASLQLRTDVPEVHFYLARALHERGRLDDAIAYYRRALQLRPDYTDAREPLERALRQRAATGPDAP